MGKNGAAMLAAKAEKVKWHFSDNQLKAHDRALLEAYRERVKADLAAHLDKEYAIREQHVRELVEAEWKRREELFGSENHTDNLMQILALLLAVSCRVLIEKFHWKPIPKDGNYDRRNQLVRFSDYLVDEIQSITEDETKDIRRYCEEVREEYGVEFKYDRVEVTADEQEHPEAV